MSFGAMSAGLAWLLIAGAAAAAIGLFLVKVRPPRVTVSSLLLWRRVLDQPRDMTWWERVRRAVSLAATMIIAVALALALTRPGPAVTGSSQGRMLIVLDSSWSMLARSTGGRTRWDRAVAEAHALAASATSGDVAIATTAEGLVEGPTSDIALIEGAIDRLAPHGGEGTGWPRVAGTSAVHFLTDGTLARPLDPAVIIHSVYEAAPNVAVTAFEVRPPTTLTTPGEAYLEIANYAASAQPTRLVLSRGAGVLLDQTFDMAAGDVQRLVVPLAAEGDPRLRARVSASLNALAVDDEAVAWMADAAPLAVMVVGEQPGALAALLQRASNVRTALATPATYRPGREDVVVFDRVLPPTAPARPALCLAPPAAAWLGTVGAEERAPHWAGVLSHPVLAGVDPLTIDVKRARAYDGAGLEAIAKSERGTTLIAVADEPKRRVVVLTFGLAESNLATAAAFPVLIANALEWLGRPEGVTARRPGIAMVPASTTRVMDPGGRAVPIGHVAGAAVVALADPGFYTVEAGGAQTTIGVRVGDPDVSNLMRTSLSGIADAKAATAGRSGGAWWLYAVGVALILAAAEWWTWQRRITV
jgi:hypothetical protein